MEDVVVATFEKNPEEHNWLCHADGSLCDGGITCKPIAGRLVLLNNVGIIRPGDHVTWYSDCGTSESGPRHPSLLCALVKEIMESGLLVVDVANSCSGDDDTVLRPGWIVSKEDAPIEDD